MEARLCRLLLVLAALGSVAAGPAQGHVYRTRNFVVTAPTADIARQVGNAAEVYRKEIAMDWLGQELLPWFAPCPIKVKVGQIGAGGQTTFSFHPSQKGPDEVSGWDMQIQGSLERILDSVLPHEISHTIFACYFRRPLPRWADEGAATLIEHESERRRQVLTVKQVLGTRRRIPFNTLFSLKEYPRDMQDVMTLYAEGYTLADLLVQQGGKARYLKFLNDAHQRGWEKAVQTNYGYRNVDELEKRWNDWIVAGTPPLKLPEGQMLAQNGAASKNAGAGAIELRGQSPDSELDLESGVDPFVDSSPAPSNQVALAGGSREPSPRIRSLPRSNAARQPSAESPQTDKAVRVADPIHDEWLALDEPETRRPSRTRPDRLGGHSVEADSEEEGVWRDVPRNNPRRSAAALESGRRDVESVESDDSSEEFPAELAAETPSSRLPPSVVRQRQTPAKKGPAVRDLASRRQRTPWSEFPEGRPPQSSRAAVGVAE